ncbi:DUF192 domain-containing protein [Bacillus sp. B-jedd]|uniref:DUF192 domain-containing protein n=1 Tax=Bacillus sp. B-jedd TaxID=1476857 RepID=UPI0005155ECD|nr:DUF192 domain-containing protein [Bacillus sp. B-jedd]CEG28324.1 hypothetical protein BN1002_03234 [Bacillus sp. B-jedd]
MGRNVVIIPFPVIKADSFFTRFKGLMFRKEPISNEGLWILPCNAVHMFFMSFPLDIVLLNEQHNVVRCYPHLKPWTATKPEKRAHSTLELPAGTISRLGIEIGNQIKFDVRLGKKD